MKQQARVVRVPGQRDAEARISALRRELDRVNRELLSLLEERGRLVREVMALKLVAGRPRYDRARERAMLEALLGAETGVYPRAELERIFRAVFEASRMLPAAGGSTSRRHESAHRQRDARPRVRPIGRVSGARSR